MQRRRYITLTHGDQLALEYTVTHPHHGLGRLAYMLLQSQIEYRWERECRFDRQGCRGLLARLGVNTATNRAGLEQHRQIGFPHGSGSRQQGLGPAPGFQGWPHRM